MDRSTYRRKSEINVAKQLHREFGEFYLIPEGGSNSLALHGCAEIIEEITVDFDVICCSCGTGGTLAGIAGALRKDQRALGFAVLKGASFLNDDVSAFQESAFGRTTSNWSIEQGFHFGGYAKKNVDLKRFISSFEALHEKSLKFACGAKDHVRVA
jgi:1-aminocyclopropane-1-carboxylate deaminase